MIPEAVPQRTILEDRPDPGEWEYEWLVTFLNPWSRSTHRRKTMRTQNTRTHTCACVCTHTYMHPHTHTHTHTHAKKKTTLRSCTTTCTHMLIYPLHPLPPPNPIHTFHYTDQQRFRLGTIFLLIGMRLAVSASCVFTLRLHASLPGTYNWLFSLMSASLLKTLFSLGGGKRPTQPPSQQTHSER